MFGMSDLNFIQLSSIFFKSNAIVTDLIFFLVVTTGDTKQYYSTFCNFSKGPDLILLCVSSSTKAV